MFSIRPVRPADAAALVELYARLSAGSRHARFLGSVGGLSTRQSAGFCHPDHDHGEGFVAVSNRPADRGTLLGHLCLEPADEGALEVAVVVADAEQGRGIGRALWHAALAWAAAHQFRTIVASCMADNWRVLSLLRTAPFSARIEASDAGVVDVTVPLTPPLERAA